MATPALNVANITTLVNNTYNDLLNTNPEQAAEFLAAVHHYVADYEPAAALASYDSSPLRGVLLGAGALVAMGLVFLCLRFTEKVCVPFEIMFNCCSAPARGVMNMLSHCCTFLPCRKTATVVNDAEYDPLLDKVLAEVFALLEANNTDDSSSDLLEADNTDDSSYDSVFEAM